MPDQTDLKPQLRRVPLFSELGDDDIERIEAYTRERSVDKGGFVFQRGDAPQGFYFVVSGQIKLAITSEQGNEKVVEVIHSGQTFGEAVMFLNRRYPVFAEALFPTRLLHIAQNVVTDLIDTDPRFAHALLASMAIRLHGLIRDVEAYSLRSSTQRVIGFLLQTDPSPEQGGRHEIRLATSKQILASRLNLTPETLSRIFHDLSSEGLIEVKGRSIILLDTSRLASYSI